MTKVPIVNNGLCKGHEICVSVAPEVFEMVDGKAEVKNPKGAGKSTIESAINSCPEKAISWKDE